MPILNGFNRLSKHAIRVVIVSCVYPPEPVVSARTSSDLASHLAGTGVVTVFCPKPSRPFGISYEGGFANHESDNPRVVRLRSKVHPASGMIGRMIESISFGLSTVIRLCREKEKPDVVYVNSWPIFAQLGPLIYCNLFYIPTVLSVQDMYPEALVQKLHPLIATIVGAPLWVLDVVCSQLATQVVVIGRHMDVRYRGTRFLTKESLIMVPNWQDEARYAPRSISEPAPKVPFITNRFTFLYLGNIGPVAGVDRIVEAFVKHTVSGAQLVIAGSGVNKEKCVMCAGTRAGQDVWFLSGQVIQDDSEIQAMANVLVLPMRSGVGSSSLPSKLVGYMLSAKPILAIVEKESEVATIITEANCGWVVSPDSLETIGNAIDTVASADRASLVEMGKRARFYALAHFGRRAGLGKLGARILALAKEGFARESETRCI